MERIQKTQALFDCNCYRRLPTKNVSDSQRHLQTIAQIKLTKRQTATQAIERPALRRTVERGGTKHQCDLTRPGAGDRPLSKYPFDLTMAHRACSRWICSDRAINSLK